MSKTWQPRVNAPFEKLHRSLSPFAPWGLDYDNYSSATQVERWLDQAGADSVKVRGTGFGFNKWFIDNFMLAPWLEAHAPAVLERYLSASMVGGGDDRANRPFNRWMEKFVVKGRKRKQPTG